MKKHNGKYPYLQMSRDEIRAIDNDTLVKLVAEFNQEDVEITSWRYREGMRLVDEQTRRILDGTIDRNQYWK